MVNIKKERMLDGYDCWGKAEYDDVYVVTDDNGNVIYKSKNDPTGLIVWLKNKLTT